MSICLGTIVNPIPFFLLLNFVCVVGTIALVTRYAHPLFSSLVAVLTTLGLSRYWSRLHTSFETAYRDFVLEPMKSGSAWSSSRPETYMTVAFCIVLPFCLSVIVGTRMQMRGRK